MTMKQIRDQYRVPAKRGMRIAFNGQPAVIIGSRGMYLRVRMNDGGYTATLHPTWRVDYEPEGESK